MSVFAIGDLHLGHSNILKMTTPSGTLLRPFSSLHSMHERIIEGWNSVVGNNDLTFVLGDLSFSALYMQQVMPRLRGTKILVGGNHDHFRLNQYRPFFQNIVGVYTKGPVILTHIPIHPSCMNRWKVNYHGHLHDKSLPDGRYRCLSAELLDYVPFKLET